MLQRPGFNGAASCGTRKVHQLHHQPRHQQTLQWGRVLWDAESGSSGFGRVIRLSFNGAASCGTRKGGSGWPRLCCWPCFNGAASCGTRKDLLVIDEASMVDELQWGRVLWDAERRGGRRAIPYAISCFNGAASCGTRKARGRFWEQGTGKTLQWGRVLWDAERMTLPLSRLPAVCFNGAASCGTRKVELGDISRTRQRCFNGAASCGTRKAGAVHGRLVW